MASKAEAEKRPTTACTVKLTISDFDGELRVLGFRGVDRISELYRYEVDIALHRGNFEPGEVDADALDLAATVGKKASLLFESPDLADATGAEGVSVHGVVARVEQRDRSEGHTRYRVSLVPRAYRLTQRTNCRIFQEQTAQEIVQKVLEGHQFKAGKDFKFSLKDTPPKRGYCVQYRESDWDFISRLLEEEGIFCFFKHDGASELLQMGSDYEVHPPIPGKVVVPYRRREDAAAHEEHVTGWAVSQQIRSGAVRLRDWNFETPDLENQGRLEVEKADADGPADLEIYDHPGLYTTGGEGKVRARTRLEQVIAERTRARGESSSPRFSAGAYLELEGHYRSDFDERYLLLEVLHEAWSEPDSFSSNQLQHTYSNSFTCQPRRIPFRPAHQLEKRLISGVQTALVVGAKGEEIHTDEHGRVKLKFHWDRGDDMEAPTCWVRVAQIWGSGTWGAMFIPRIGQEVVVAFEEGDPDRPLVVGTVYYGDPPYPLPARKTVSTIKSSSSLGEDGSNELRFEDKKGSEEVYAHAQKDLVVAVEHDETRTVGNDRTTNVENDDSLSVTGNRSVKVEKNLDEKITENQSTAIDGSLSINVAKTAAVDVSKDASVTIGGNLSLSVDKEMSVSVTKKFGAELGDEASVDVTKTLKIKAKKVVIEVEDELAIKVGDAQLSMKKNGDITLKGGKISVTSSKDLTLKSDSKLTMKASSDAKLESSANVVLKGSKVAGN